MSLPAIVSLASTLVAAAAGVPAAYEPGDAPGSLRPAIARGEAATRELQARLQARLGRALAEGGPAAGIRVCRDEAPRLAAEVSAETGVRVGRTSDRLRSPANAPPAWARPAVEAASGRRGAEVKPSAVDLGDRVGLLVPIRVGSACLRCHGARDALDPAVRRALGEAYPADRATGYAEGDHRGFFWAEAAK